MRKRVWKVFQIETRDDIASLQGMVSATPPGYTFRVDRYVGGGFVESDLPLRELRRMFRMAGVRWRDYVTERDDPANAT